MVFQENNVSLYSKIFNRNLVYSFSIFNIIHSHRKNLMHIHKILKCLLKKIYLITYLTHLKHNAFLNQQFDVKMV